MRGPALTLEVALWLASVGSLVVACASHPAATGAPRGADAAPVAAGPHVEGDHFKVDAVLEAPCAAGAVCKVAIHLQALGGFHVNAEYPHKFTGAAVDGVEFLGANAAKKNVFSKPAGDFTLEAPGAGVLEVRFKAQPGARAVRGTLKVGVCSDETCMIPQVDLSVPVPVT